MLIGRTLILDFHELRGIEVCPLISLTNLLRSSGSVYSYRRNNIKVQVNDVFMTGRIYLIQVTGNLLNVTNIGAYKVKNCVHMDSHIGRNSSPHKLLYK